VGLGFRSVECRRSRLVDAPHFVEDAPPRGVTRGERPPMALRCDRADAAVCSRAFDVSSRCARLRFALPSSSGRAVGAAVCYSTPNATRRACAVSGATRGPDRGATGQAAWFRSSANCARDASLTRLIGGVCPADRATLMGLARQCSPAEVRSTGCSRTQSETASWSRYFSPRSRRIERDSHRCGLSFVFFDERAPPRASLTDVAHSRRPSSPRLSESTAPSTLVRTWAFTTDVHAAESVA
jgi:hypothetical protein